MLFQNEDRERLQEIKDRLRALDWKLTRLERKLMANLQAIKDAVAAEHTVTLSVLALITKLAADLAAAIADDDPAAVQAIVDQLNTDKDALAAAVTANTPAAPATP